MFRFQKLAGDIHKALKCGDARKIDMACIPAWGSVAGNLMSYSSKFIITILILQDSIIYVYEMKGF